MPVDIFFPSPS